ncbi:tyrosine-type recombinase/integrase [Paenibacillus glycinis]|uniref:Tyrosine-type recombinase/integrase n=1 Tax=Paenibacillus glycinis TaxID=2697035 RepID=A0ABW9XZ45_9BACL|nr:site-specific integrase [Paenibacillus glycinis]NBD27999.1 tyrosine-type recombinase/integrase [Paenibacillus glycinis]
MKNVLSGSNYFKQWQMHADVRKRTLNEYSYLLIKFGQYLVVEKGFTGELDFDKFIYYPEDGTYLPINERFINNYFSYLESIETSRSRLYMAVSALGNFFAFLKDMRFIKHNPMAHYKNPYYNAKVSDRGISIQDCNKLFSAAKLLDRSDPFFQKHNVLLLLMFTTGLRRNEIGGLTAEQLDFERNMIYVDRGQKTKATTVYMPKVLSLALQRYLGHPTYKKWQDAGNSNVFFSANGKKFNHLTLNEILKKLCLKAEIPRITSHCLRHTMAALLISRNVDISIIQRQLRHKYVETTLRYLPTATIDELQLSEWSTFIE